MKKPKCAAKKARGCIRVITEASDESIDFSAWLDRYVTVIVAVTESDTARPQAA